MFKNIKKIMHAARSGLGCATPAMVVFVLGLGACIEAENLNPDAGPPVEDAAVPLRTLEQHALFGKMPIENRVLDPQFGLLDGSGWGAYGNAGTITSVRNFRTHTPLQQPALEVQKKANTQWIVAMGQVKSKPGPLSAMLWVGRELDALDAELSQVTVGIIGLYNNQGVQTAELQLDARYEPTQLSGIEWRLFSAQIEDGPIGWCDWVVTDDANPTLYLSSPIVVPADTDVTWSLPYKVMQKAKLRAATERERSALGMRKAQARHS